MTTRMIPPASCRYGMSRSSVTSAVPTTRSPTASAPPATIARVRCFVGSCRAAMPMTSALSPDSARSISTIARMAWRLSSIYATIPSEFDVALARIGRIRKISDHTDMSAPFARFAETAERVRSTSSTLAKANALAELLRELGDEDLAIACRLFAGAPFASADQRVLGIGWSAVLDIVLELSRAGEGELSTSYQKHADVGDVTAELLAAHDWQSESPPLTFADLAAAFERIASTRGAVAKREILESLMRRATSLEAKYLVKIVTGEMRIGLRAGLLEGAIAKGTGAPKAKVARAAMLTGDVGETAVRARRGTLDETRLHLFHPLGWMLATPVLALREVAKRFPPPYLVEGRYDGVRVQVHKEGARVEIYYRTLDVVTHRFPEVIEPLR